MLACNLIKNDFTVDMFLEINWISYDYDYFRMTAYETLF